MRTSKFNGYEGRFRSSFLSCENDTESIIKKLFVNSRPYSDELKRLLIINTPDCLDDKTNPYYIKKVNETTVKDLRDKGYIRLEPKISFGENEEVKTYISISYDNFSPNLDNDYYRDCYIMIDIMCSPDCWDIGNYRLRPFKIAGYIDGILNNSRLQGIGTLNFVSCREIVLSEKLCGYCLIYSATHGIEDVLSDDEE